MEEYTPFNQNSRALAENKNYIAPESPYFSIDSGRSGIVPMKENVAAKRIIPPPPLGWKSWEVLMLRALALADEAETDDEVPVGAVVVSPQGEIIGQGRNAPAGTHDATAHAEILAIRSACATLGNYRLGGCTLVVTLEPCLMCAGAMAHARIAGVVYGAKDPAAGAVVSRMEGLDAAFLNHRTWHMGGIMEKECAQRLHHFFARCRDAKDVTCP